MVGCGHHYLFLVAGAVRSLHFGKHLLPGSSEIPLFSCALMSKRPWAQELSKAFVIPQVPSGESNWLDFWHTRP